ncbi:SLC13 family permease [Pseudobutyrivibrio ruminis]|uniref:SLC13 family permease n=1 Tax=Pseudobutyrivibrio ruminis TaxID=46206 RepID=UPI00040198B9|nr:SLC13 family permease [Pseudobutyrivibrio ruminis]
MEAVKHFIKNEIVLCVAGLLAVASAFVVHPSKSYLGYIDFRTLSILLMLMITMAGLQKLSVFRQLGELLVGKMSTIRGVVLILIGLCFFSSMFITNDVALLTFVPFSIITLSISNRKDLYIIVIVLETLAANLGSMLTPLGNPQNLYLYSLSGMSMAGFIKLMLPYSLCSALLLIISALIFVKDAKVTLKDNDRKSYDRTKREKRLIGLYIAAFIISLFVVARLVSYQVGLVIVLIAVIAFDRNVLRKPDYSLLFTFIFLFIFIGNIKRIPEFSQVLESLIKINEVGVSIVLSQFISNVPAAILCSGFADDLQKIIIGTNLGGMGTLIASMASLISFKQYSYIDGAKPQKYIGIFTVLNIVYLALMIVVYWILQL